jgi:hypothetical protein
LGAFDCFLTAGSDNDEQSNMDEEYTIETKILKEYDGKLDDNGGNIAYVVSNFGKDKKPVSDRKIINWGISQSQRGRTTVYPRCL